MRSFVDLDTLMKKMTTDTHDNEDDDNDDEDDVMELEQARAMSTTVTATTTRMEDSAAATADNTNAGDCWHVWQMVDSLYPTGGFAHSLGLEAAVQERLVTPKTNSSNSTSASAGSCKTPLDQFVRSTLHQTGNFALPIVFTMHTRAVASAGDRDAMVAAFLDVNAQATALFSNHVAKKASLAQGAAMLRLALSTYHRHTNDAFSVLLTLRKETKRREHPGVHHAVVFALVCALLGVDSATCQRFVLFAAVRDVLSAATRLNLIGPFEAARTQFELRDVAARAFERCRDRAIADAYSSAPVLDLVQAMHDQLYTRIFNS